MHVAAMRDRLLEGRAVEITIAAGEFAVLIEDHVAGIIEGVLLAAAGDATLFAQLQGDVGGVALVAAVEGDVVGDQEFAGAGDQGAGLRVEGGRAEVGGPVRVLEFLFQALVLALAHHGEVAPFGAARRMFVKIDRESRVRVPTRSPSLRASAAQVVQRHAPPQGTNGQTSVAPMRGWAPWWIAMSITWAAVLTAWKAASTTASG